MKLLEISQAQVLGEGFPISWSVLKVEGAQKPILLHHNWMNERARRGLPPLQVGDGVEFEPTFPTYRDMPEYLFVKNFRVVDE